MGYTTEFTGAVAVSPPLNVAEIEYLKRFSRTRHMDRAKGPYFADGAYEQGERGDVRDTNQPCAGVPGLWCKWVANEDGTLIEWSGAEKFYDSIEWMQYLIDHFLKPGAVASITSDPQFKEFTFDHVVNGTIDAEGEEPGDLWRLVVTDNVVREAKAVISYEDVAPAAPAPRMGNVDRIAF